MDKENKSGKKASGTAKSAAKVAANAGIGLGATMAAGAMSASAEAPTHNEKVPEVVELTAETPEPVSQNAAPRPTPKVEEVVEEYPTDNDDDVVIELEEEQAQKDEETLEEETQEDEDVVDDKETLEEETVEEDTTHDHPAGIPEGIKKPEIPEPIKPEYPVIDIDVCVYGGPGGWEDIDPIDIDDDDWYLLPDGDETPQDDVDINDL